MVGAVSSFSHEQGADSVMYERALGQGNDRLLEHLRMFASEGLRTLVLARRQLSKAEYVAWNQCVAVWVGAPRVRGRVRAPLTIPALPVAAAHTQGVPTRRQLDAQPQ